MVDRLLEEGHQVIVLDNFSTGRQENLAHYSKAAALSIHRLDIADFEAIQPYFQGVDWVFHIAGLDMPQVMYQTLERFHQQQERSY